MKFYQRFAYYLVGLVMGAFVVTSVFIGKDTRCNYFPNARVLNDLRTKPFEFSEKSIQILDQKWIDTADIRQTLKYGDVDFDKSNLAYKKGKLYTIYGKTKANQSVTLKITNYADKAVLEEIIKNEPSLKK